MFDLSQKVVSSSNHFVRLIILSNEPIVTDNQNILRGIVHGVLFTPPFSYQPAQWHDFQKHMVCSSFIIGKY